MPPLKLSEIWGKAIEVYAPAVRTSTPTPAAIDLKPYKGIVAILLHCGAGTGNADNTLASKVQDCDTTGGTYADTGITGTTVDATAGGKIQIILVDTRKVREFIKLVLTLAGTTPSFASEAALIAIEEYPAAP